MAQANTDLLGVAEVAKMLGLKERQARTLVAKHAGVMLGGSWFMRRGDVGKIPKDRKPGPRPARSPKRKASR